MEKNIHVNRIKTSIFALLSLVLTYAGFDMLNDTSITDTFLRVLAVFDIFSFGFGALLFSYYTIINKKLCTMNETGITIGGIKPIFIPWKDIYYVYIPKDENIIFGIEVEDKNKHPFAPYVMHKGLCKITKDTKKELYQILEQYTSVIMDNDK